MKLILASNSPRRKDLLRKAGYEFDIIVSPYEENLTSCDPVFTAETFAFGKAQAVFDMLCDNSALVVGADTVVYLDGKILGKPENEIEAVKMLKSLSGKTHKVITGYAVISKNIVVKGSVKTSVTFNDLSEKLISEYINSGLWQGKAGAYGIQDPFALVKSYDGSLNNVIGFPTETVFPIIDKIMKE